MEYQLVDNYPEVHELTIHFHIRTNSYLKGDNIIYISFNKKMCCLATMQRFVILPSPLLTSAVNVRTIQEGAFLDAIASPSTDHNI